MDRQKDQLSTSDCVLEDLLRCEMTEISHEGYENVEGDDDFVACGMLTLRWNPLGN